MTNETIGTARIDIVVDSSNMQANLKAAERSISQFGTDAEAQFNRANKSTKALAGSLIRQIELTGKTKLEQIALNAEMRIGGELGAKIAAEARARNAAMIASVAATNRASHAIHEFSLNNSFARRELGRLVTDIAKGNYGRFEQTSLTLANASGLLGKVFSKTGAAAAGMAVGLGVLLKALLDSENETAAFDKALLTTGNIANTTVPKMQALADAIAQNGATHGQAFDAVQKTAETGRFIGAQFDLVATAAARMEESTGQSIDNTIKKFEAIAQDPVNALLKLNETEHFLTKAQLDRVQALVDEGRQQDAVTEGARIYADRLNDVATAADEARPHLARMWSDSKKELSSLWDDTKNFTEFLAATADKFKQMPWYERGSFGAIGYVKSLFGAEPVVPTSPKPVANTVNSDAEEAARRAREALAKFASPTDKLKAAEDEAKKKFLAAIYGISDPATIAKYKADMEREVEDAKEAIARAQRKHHNKGPENALASFQQYVNGLNPASLTVQGDAELTKYVQDMAKLTEKFDQTTAKGADVGKSTALFWAGADDEVRKYSDALSAEMNRQNAADAAYASQLQDQLDTRKQAIALQVASIGMGQKESQEYQALNEVYRQFDRQLAQLNKERDEGSISIAQYSKRLAELNVKETETVSAMVNGFKAQQLAEENGMNGMNAAIQDFLDEQRNVAAQTQQFTTDFISEFGDAFASFASNTESAKDAFGSFIDDLERQALKALANKAIQELLQLGRTGPSGYNVGYFGQFSDSAAASTADEFIAGLGYDGGGYTGPGGKYQPAGLVHKGEDVWSQEDIARAGGIQVVEAMRRGVSSNRKSGAVGVLAAPRAYSNTQIINVNVQPTSTRRTAEQVATEVARKQRIAAARNG